MATRIKKESDYSIPTRLIYGKARSRAWDYSHHVIPPISASSTFRLASAQRGAEGFRSIGLNPETSGPIYVYDRMGEPNTDLLEHALAVAEGGEMAFTFSTGMAAVSAATLAFLREGDEVIAHKTLYGCTYTLFTEWFPRYGIKVIFHDFTSPSSFLTKVTPRTRLVYLESPANPNLELIDLPAVSRALKTVNAQRPKRHRIISVIDNTFATPFCQRPIEHGIDVVLHSLTKGLSGFGVSMGGAVITREEFRRELFLFRKDFGAVLTPQSAWQVLVYGLPTLALRLPVQQKNALKLARFLEQHPTVKSVSYPGLSSHSQYAIARRILRDYEGKFAPGMMLSFSLRARSPAEARAKGEKLMNWIAKKAYAITLAVSLGQLRTLIEHPGSMTHAGYPPEEQLARGIDPGLIRLAVGVESTSDLISDLRAALTAVG